MKSIIALAFAISFFGCNSDFHSINTISAFQLPDTIDAGKFNKSFVPDTIGCSWITREREIIDSLVFRKLVVQSNTDTFLATPRYRRLWTCKIPTEIMIPGDTIVVSAIIYKLYANENGIGFPALITRIFYDSSSRR